VVHFNGNSGAQAINLAVLFGARRLVLVGFDMRDAADGTRHWFGKHVGGMERRGQYSGWVKAFDRIAADLKAWGIEAVNCSPVSALHQFPKTTLEALCPSPTT
jgi:hypothetical protein